MLHHVHIAMVFPLHISNHDVQSKIAKTLDWTPSCCQTLCTSPIDNSHWSIWPPLCARGTDFTAMHAAHPSWLRTICIPARCFIHKTVARPFMVWHAYLLVWCPLLSAFHYLSIYFQNPCMYHEDSARSETQFSKNVHSLQSVIFPICYYAWGRCRCVCFSSCIILTALGVYSLVYSHVGEVRVRGPNGAGVGLYFLGFAVVNWNGGSMSICELAFGCTNAWALMPFLASHGVTTVLNTRWPRHQCQVSTVALARILYQLVSQFHVIACCPSNGLLEIVPSPTKQTLSTTLILANRSPSQAYRVYWGLHRYS